MSNFCAGQMSSRLACSVPYVCRLCDAENISSRMCDFPIALLCSSHRQVYGQVLSFYKKNTLRCLFIYLSSSSLSLSVVKNRSDGIFFSIFSFVHYLKKKKMLFADNITVWNFFF